MNSLRVIEHLNNRKSYTKTVTQEDRAKYLVGPSPYKNVTEEKGNN